MQSHGGGYDHWQWLFQDAEKDSETAQVRSLCDLTANLEVLSNTMTQVKSGDILLVRGVESWCGGAMIFQM